MIFQEVHQDILFNKMYIVAIYIIHIYNAFSILSFIYTYIV